jgi:acyl-CoA hydrolase
VDEINFHHPVRLGDVVTLQASVNRAFRTSMEIGVVVTAESRSGHDSRRANNAYLTFVAIDESGRPVSVPGVIPESQDEIRRFDEALLRRERRLANRRP